MADKSSKNNGGSDPFADFINSHADIVGGGIVLLLAIALIVSIVQSFL